MKAVQKYLWIAVLLALIIHGASVMREAYQHKVIHDRGETVEVEIEELNCGRSVMTFAFESISYEKKIDARTCVVFNEGQKIKLKHSREYPDIFLFVNETRPGRLILGALEIATGIIGILANWPLINPRRSRRESLSLVS